MNISNVKIPYIDANIQNVVIRSIYFDELDKVEKGDLLFTVSSVKAVQDIYSDQDGYIVNFVKEEEKVEVQTVIAKIFEEKEGAKKYIDNNHKEKSEIKSENILATKLAKEIAIKNNIDIKSIKKDGIIKKNDVLNFLSKDKKNSKKSNNNIEDNCDRDYNPYKINENFIKMLKKNKEVFSKLDSDMKINIYNNNNAKIDKTSKLSKGSLLLAKKIYIGENSYIGENVNIIADYIYIGAGVTITDNVNIATTLIKIDDGTSIVDNTRVGGGSSFEEDSAFIVGEDCLLADCNINTTCKVEIGNRVAISPGTRLFTHHHWQNVLEGGFVSFEGIKIGNDVHITANCTLAPGVTLGNNVLVLANSNVNRDLDDNVIAGGNPINIINEEYMKEEIGEQKKYQILKRDIIPSVKRHLQKKNYNFSITLAEGKNIINDNAEILFLLNEINIEEDKYKIIIDVNKPKILKSEDDQLLNEIRYILRKYGIRFKMDGWRY